MKVTENALTEFKKLLDDNEKPVSAIRFFTTQGCCSPILQIEMVDSPSAGDLVVTIGEMDFFLTPDADKILSGITIDFTEGEFRSVKNA